MLVYSQRKNMAIQLDSKIPGAISYIWNTISKIFTKYGFRQTQFPSRLGRRKISF